MTEPSDLQPQQLVNRCTALGTGGITLGSLLGLAAAKNEAQETKPKRGVATNPVSALTERLNPQVQHTREVALKILNPTPKELERGLRLHAESIVFDAYGFAPTCRDRWRQAGGGHQRRGIGYRN